MVDSGIFWLRMAAFLYAVGLLHSMLAILRHSSSFYPFALGTFRVGVVLHGVAIVELAGAYGRLPVESFYGTLSLCAFLIALTGGRIVGDPLSWDRAGRWIAGTTLLVAAVYELTPLKDVCLGKCRSPLGFLLGSWRDGRSGAVRMGMKNGAWCVGCCWALMASLFALGIMSLVWMAFVAGLIAVEKVFPWRRTATYATAALLFALGLLLLVAPEVIPALTIPGGMMSPAMG